MNTSVAPASLSLARLPGLDALRGVAALCVVLLHVHVLMPGFPDLMPRGYLAVDFFFMLSGFVMARTYEPRLATGFTGWHFLKARYRRLWPTMAVGGLLFLPYLEEGAKWEDVHLMVPFVLNMALLPSPTTKNFFPLNIPAWSIFFELAANALHGALLWRLRVPLLALLCAASLAGLVHFAKGAGSFDLGSQRGQMIAGLCRVVFSYGLGMILWRLWGERRLPPFTAWAALAVLPLCLALGPGTHAPGWLWDLGFVALVAPLLLLAGIGLDQGRRLALLAGELSFPLYAVHYPVIYWARDWNLRPASAIALCLIAAWLVARFADRMMRRPETKSTA